MKKILPDDASYKTFQDILTGYRLSNTLRVAHESGVFDRIGGQRLPADVICNRTGWNEDMGERFLLTLCELGFLEENNGCFSLSQLSRKFLLKTSDNYQGNSIEFERRLIDSWGLLGPTLVKGERLYSTGDKTKEDYTKALSLYLGAMHDAAKIRACEVWDTIKPAEEGIVLDAGAGSGAFLCEFLKRHNSWKGIFCDLKDVISITSEKTEMKALSGRLTYIENNLLEKATLENDTKASILLLSNLIHCQSKEETASIFSNIIGQVAEDGVILIHDFFSDCGWRGALYDIHMMLNTYNGRTYSIEEISTMLSDFGFFHAKTIQLKSGSTILAVSRKPISSELIY